MHGAMCSVGILLQVSFWTCHLPGSWWAGGGGGQVQYMRWRFNDGCMLFFTTVAVSFGGLGIR